MEGCGRAMEFGRLCRGKLRNYESWPAEFGRIFHGKLWALVIISCCTSDVINSFLFVVSSNALCVRLHPSLKHHAFPMPV